MTARPGDPAPEVELTDLDGAPLALVALRGSPVALVFFPFAFSSTCTEEVCELRDNLEDFEAAGVRLYGVSCDPRYTLRAFAESEGLNFDLLSDFWPHGAAARAFGILDEATGAARRASFLIDRDGIIRWSVITDGGPRDLGAYRAALADI